MSTKVRIFFLTGIKHSGKSSVGLYASSHIQCDRKVYFVDVDDLILDLIHPPFSTIREFYHKMGKEAFMNVELQALKTYLQEIKREGVYIISLGGGSCDNNELVNLMKKSGTILYLSVQEETLLKRIVKNGVPPFLDPHDIKRSFHHLFCKRDGQYRNISDFVVSLADFESIESNGKLLIRFITQLLGDTTWVEIPLEHH